MAKVKVYNIKGEEKASVELNPALFKVPVKAEVIHQVVVGMSANQRQVLAHAKDRSEVRGGGRKPWRQKGTGRARHGSSRSPIWIGGGVTFGPTRERNFSKKINKKMRNKALTMVLSDRVEDKKMKVIDSLAISEYNTKAVAEVLKNLDLQKSVLVVVEKQNQQAVKSFANLPKVQLIEAKNLNVLDTVKHQNLLITVEAIKALESRLLAEKKETVKKEKKQTKSVDKAKKKVDDKKTKSVKKIDK